MKFLVITLLAITVASGIPVEEKKKICEPGVLAKKDCNDCICSPDGTSQVCTLMMCQPSEPTDIRTRRDATERVCQPGDTKMEDCNRCFCLNDGSGWGCTLMACPPKVCNHPGKRYQKYCNTCACSEDGMSEICTKKACPESIFNEDGSLVNQPGEVSQNSLPRQRRDTRREKSCEPGSTFKQYCNTCHCGSDGHTASCTLMFCPENIYNEDGSLRNVEQSQVVA